MSSKLKQLWSDYLLTISEDERLSFKKREHPSQSYPLNVNGDTKISQIEKDIPSIYNGFIVKCVSSFDENTKQRQVLRFF